MRLLFSGLLAFGLAAPAFGQSDGTIAVPPAPPIIASPVTPQIVTPPSTLPPATAPTNQDTGTAAAPPPDDSLPPQPPDSWVPGKAAQLGVLNKVDGSVSSITIPVGGQNQIGDLTVSVLACVIRPADEIPDAAVFIAATGAGAAAPIYRGWMVRSMPGAAVVGDASETFRVISCG